MSSAKKTSVADRIAKAEAKKDTKPISAATETTVAKKVAPASSAKKAAPGAKKAAATNGTAKKTKAQRDSEKEGLDLVIAGLKAISKLPAAQIKVLRKKLEADSSVHTAAESIANLALEVSVAREGKRAIVTLPENVSACIVDALEGVSVPAVEANYTSQENLQSIVKALTQSSKLSTSRSSAKVPVTSFQLEGDWLEALKEPLDAFNARRAKNRSAAPAADLANISSRDLTSVILESCSELDEDAAEDVSKMLDDELQGLVAHLKK